MSSDVLPPCLICGHLMNLTRTAATGVGLASFERQHLICPNCGESDSRLVFVSAGVNSAGFEKVEGPAIVPFQQAQIENAAVMENAAATEETATLESNPAGEKVAAELQAAAVYESGPPLFLGWREENVSFEPDPQPEEPAAEKPAEPSHKFAEVLQAYLAKWRQTRQT